MVARVLAGGDGEDSSARARSALMPAKSAFVVRPLASCEAGESARMHQEVLAAEFVARAGERFLRRYHLAWCQSPNAIALAARGPGGELTGVLLGSLEPGAHYRFMARRHGAALALHLATYAATHPSFGWELLATRGVRYLRGALRLLLARREPAARLVPEGKEGEIAHVMVAPTARGAGVGRALIQEALRVAQAAGLRQVVLVTTPAPASRGFYEHLGWQRYGDVTSRSGEHFARYRWLLPPRGY